MKYAVTKIGSVSEPRKALPTTVLVALREQALLKAQDALLAATAYLRWILVRKGDLAAAAALAH